MHIKKLVFGYTVWFEGMQILWQLFTEAIHIYNPEFIEFIVTLAKMPTLLHVFGDRAPSLEVREQVESG